MSIVSLISIIALCLALAGLASFLANRSKRWVQPLPMRRVKDIMPESRVGEPGDWELSTALLIIRDAIAKRAQPIRKRINSLSGDLNALRVKADSAGRSSADTQADLDRVAAVANAQRPPLVSARIANLLTLGLLFGDLAVVTMAVQSESASVSPGYAFLAAMAFGLAIFSMGYIPGHYIKNWLSKRDPSKLQRQSANELRVAAVCLLGCIPLVALALVFLREVHEWHWVILSMTPALGAAAVKLMGPTPEQREVPKLARKHARQEERRVKAEGPVKKLEGQVEALQDQLELAIVEAILTAGATLKRLDISLGELKGMLDQLGVVVHPTEAPLTTGTAIHSCLTQPADIQAGERQPLVEGFSTNGQSPIPACSPSL